MIGIGNILVTVGIIFLVYLFFKTRKTIKEIEQSKKNIEKIFLYGAKSICATEMNKSQPPIIS